VFVSWNNDTTCLRAVAKGFGRRRPARRFVTGKGYKVNSRWLLIVLKANGHSDKV
jgi:hypothetical protein